MPKIYWLGTFISGLILLMMGQMDGKYGVVPYILIAVGITGYFIQTWFEQKRRR